MSPYCALTETAERRAIRQGVAVLMPLLTPNRVQALRRVFRIWRPRSRYRAARKATTAFSPPKAKAFESAAPTVSFRASFGMTSSEHSGSGIV